MIDHTENARTQADAQLASIVEMVAALECDFDRLEELREERDGHVDHDASADAPDAVHHAAWSVEHPDDAEELAELEEATGECTSEEEARERITDDALSLEVRSEWHSPGDDSEPTEFQILLCTGGPAVRIMGELAQGEPSRAWLEYQDWGTPWTERVNQDGDHDALLSYARCFYFGE